MKKPVLSLITLWILSACSLYQPLRLDTKAALKSDINELDRGTSVTAKKLTVDDIVTLALNNNPDLLAVRRQKKLAQAQTVAAGALPNPSIGGSYDFLMSGPGTMDAFSANISQDIKSLITFSSKQQTAAYAEQQVDAEILWQEWQTIGKARLLYVDVVQGDKVLALLQANSDLFDQRLEKSRQALAQGDSTLVIFAPDIAAAGDLKKQLNDLRRTQLTQRQELDNLLGLKSTVQLQLDDSATLPAIDTAKIDGWLASLPERRPDLVALNLGYQSQDEKLYSAILAQFPTLSLGIGTARDTGNVKTLGPQISLDLPIFDWNKSNIAIERATRQQLHDEYAARLATARDEIQRLVASQSLLAEQLRETKAQAAELADKTSHIDEAYKNSDIDARTYVDLATARIARQQEAEALTQTLLEQQVAIATLVGAGMPQISTPDNVIGLN